MSSGGSSKPDEVKASEGEKMQAQVAKDQINYYRSTYAPLEKQYAEEAGRDYSGRLSGQAGTAGSRALTETLQVAGAAGAPLDTAALSSGTSLGRVAGMAEGQRLSADGKLNALKVGLGATADATRSLTESSRMQTDSLIQSQQLKLDEAKTKSAGRAMTLAAIGQAGGMAAGYYGAGKLEALQTQKLHSMPGFGAAEARYGTAQARTLAGADMLPAAQPNVRSTARGGRR